MAALAPLVLLAACSAPAADLCVATPPCSAAKASEDAVGVCTPPAPCGARAVVPVATAPMALLPGFQAWTDGYVDEMRFVVGDQLQITLPYYADETTLARIAPDGNLYIGLLGAVPAVNRSPGDVEADLERRYGRYLRFPEVGIVPADLSHRLVFVGGEVAKPGAIVLRGPTGVLEAVYEAGGFQNTARQETVILIRRGPNGQPMSKIVDLKSFAKAGPVTENTLLQPFDIIVVPKTQIARLNLFVTQYLDGVVPFNQSFNYVLYDVAAP